MPNIFKHSTQYIVRMMYCVLLFLTACAPAATPAYFIPPTAPSNHPTGTSSANIASPTPGVVEAGETPTPEIIPTEAPDLPSPTPVCTNSLKFVEDITITDGTVLAAGEAFIKQWRVKNDGTCDWTSAYKLKLVSGDPLSGPAETTLYPAAAGADAVIEMNLITPTEPGPYHTVWQAYAPDGTPFEQAIYVDIVVE
jgi:hypothetical protein